MQGLHKCDVGRCHDGWVDDHDHVCVRKFIINYRLSTNLMNSSHLIMLYGYIDLLR